MPRYYSKLKKKLKGKGRKFAIVNKWQLKTLPKIMNYFNNDKTIKYFDIRTNFLNKMLEKKKY